MSVSSEEGEVSKQARAASGHGNQKGMIPRTVDQIFRNIEALKRKKWSYSVKMSIMEIYNEDIRDLLVDPKQAHKMKDKYRVCADRNDKRKTIVTNLSVYDVHCPEEVYAYLQKANKNKKIGATGCNARSSRSHTVFQLYLEGKNSKLNKQVSSIMRLVDLAGSERLSQSGASGTARKEAQCINTSLSALVGCIKAIASKKDHVPFRNSKLTHLLKDSLSGSSKTMFFINISPDAHHHNESLCTLRFAQQLRNCRLTPAQMNVVGRRSTTSQ